MIAEIVPGTCDVEGKKVFRPFDRRKGIRPTYPLGRYVSQPLSIKCESVEDIRQFLRSCSYVSDKELFDKDDYWQPPEVFEQIKKGDCDDFAFWTWRQLMALGLETRIVFGRYGRYGIGHAWVQMAHEGRWFIVEPTVAFLGSTFPRIKTLRYHPRYSVAWDGDRLTYFAHQPERSLPPFGALLPLVPEYIISRTLLCFRILTRLHRLLWHLGRRLFKNLRWNSANVTKR